MSTGKQRLHYGGIDLTDGVFTVVKTSTYNEDMEKASKSDLFIPLLLDGAGFDNDGQVTGRKFYLADVDAAVPPGTAADVATAVHSDAPANTASVPPG